MIDIKFRAIYKPDLGKDSNILIFEQKEIDYELFFVNGNIKYDFAIPFLDKDWLVLQYTGFKTKNIEVYKSDIIKGIHKTTKKEIIAEVVWDEWSFKWGIKMDNWIMGFDCLAACYDFEIIGNIYTMSKLLEKPKMKGELKA